MPEKKVVVKNPHGLHARPAALFVQKAASFPCSIRIHKAGKQADAKSILGLMSLGIEPEEEILLVAEGDRAEEALDALEVVASDPSL
jgi:phosphotransferase system HPr (HPr) family protein